MNQSAAVRKEVKEVEGVLDAKITTGMYDIILKVQGDDERKLMELISGIKMVNGVKFVITSVVRNSDEPKSP